MRTLIQRVTHAKVSEKAAYNKPIAEINQGMLILVGFETADSVVGIEQMAQKIKNLRIFSDASGKLNLSGSEVGADYLLTSQFTLYADCKYGSRPSFDKAANKGRAKEYYEHFVKTLERILGPENVLHSPFGLDLAVELVNDGPVTLWLDSNEVL